LEKDVKNNPQIFQNDIKLPQKRRVESDISSLKGKSFKSKQDAKEKITLLDQKILMVYHVMLMPLFKLYLVVEPRFLIR
jgi:hypothetical protein